MNLIIVARSRRFVAGNIGQTLKALERLSQRPRAKEVFLDRIYRIARIEYERMNDRSEAPHALVRGEALKTQIKALEKLHGLGTS